MTTLIVTEGPIGGGKTTMNERICEERGWEIVPEPVEDHPFLDEYYAAMQALQNPDLGDEERFELEGKMMRLSYLTQKYTQHMRGGAHNLAKKKGDGVKVMDRSLPGDWAFAYANWRMGFIAEDKWDLYNFDLEEYWKEHKPADLIIRVTMSIDTQIERIKRRGRAMEQSIPRKYLELLDEGLDIALENYSKRFGVTIIEVSNEKTYENLGDLRYSSGEEEYTPQELADFCLTVRS